MSERSVLVVGGGIVGLATALQLKRAAPDLHLTLVEKEPGVGRHQTGHNSGVLHAGLYYTPGSAKARLAVRGIRLMREFCAEHGVPHETCGKLVVATDEPERTRLHALHERGTANGLSGLRLLSPQEAREIEPHVDGLAALHVPEEGIVDYAAVCAAMVREIVRLGGEVRTGEEFLSASRADGRWHITTSGAEHTATLLVTCGGLHADRVARAAGADPEGRIVPFRGEYFLIRPERQFLVRNLIYPVPDPAFPFLGVHFTRMIGGGVEAGPNAVLALKREGYRRTDVAARDAFDALTYPGLWRFIRRYPRAALYEIRRSLSRSLFTRSLQKLIPEIREDDLLPGGAGVRAQAMRANGDLVQDFLFTRAAGALHVINAPSPAATASLAIGEEVAAAALETIAS